MIRAARLAIALLLGACAGAPEAPPPATVAAVDLQRYAGTWYEVARFPNSFQDGGGRACTATTATYSGRPDGRIGVLNRCLDASGQEVSASATAYPVEGSANARLRVTFFWPFYGDYWVIGLDPDYRWAVVGAPGRNFLWILSRSPGLAAGDYAEAVGIAAAQGFAIHRLRPTPQPGT
jgi:apolipoprotein D and lipocalin family protein